MNKPEISITFDGRNCDYSIAFQKLALEKLNQHYSRAPVIEIKLICSVANKEHLIKAHVHMHNKYCVIEDVSWDMYKTLDLVIEKVSRVIWDQKQKMHNPDHHSATRKDPQNIDDYMTG